MSQSEKKRKRDADQEDWGVVKPSKAPRTETTTNENGVADSEKPKKEKSGSSKQKKSERKSKKELKLERKRASKVAVKKNAGADEDGLATGQDFVALTDVDNDSKPKIKAKKGAIRKEPRVGKGVSPRMERKRKRDAKNAALAAAAAAEGNENGDTEQPQPLSKDAEEKSEPSKSRFIVFVGNLPYDATVEQVQAHFAKLQPSSVRHQTDKKTGKGKGFAFLEFSNYDRMKTCLELYHHSIFDPHGTAEGENGTTNDGGFNNNNNNRKSRGRKLNVELTAGGGGKSDDRKSKIAAKNKKLAEERDRTKLKKAQKKADAERKRILKKEKEAKRGKRTGANAQAVAGGEDAVPQAGLGDVHPSRLGRVTG